MISSYNTESMRNKSLNVDDLDNQIIDLLAADNDNKQISALVKVPLSTIQRRTRKLFEKGLVHSRIELNYNKMGFRKGFIEICLSNGCIDKIGQQILYKQGITDVTVHIGNSDLICTCIYRSNDHLLRILADIRSIQGVDKVAWSEEVYSIKSNS